MHFRSEIRILTEVSYARAPNGSDKHRTVRSDALECACQSGEKEPFLFFICESLRNVLQRSGNSSAFHRAPVFLAATPVALRFAPPADGRRGNSARTIFGCK